eukprot:gene7598-biopygen5387
MMPSPLCLGPQPRALRGLEPLYGIVARVLRRARAQRGFIYFYSFCLYSSVAPANYKGFGDDMQCIPEHKRETFP